jgi:hypothetical protein
VPVETRGKTIEEIDAQMSRGPVPGPQPIKAPAQ